MQILKAQSAGFCFGVKRAVDEVYKNIEKGEKIYTYGPIIHNDEVVKDLESKGVELKNPFTMSINRVVKTFPDVKARPFAILEKSCSCSCFCFCRPEAFIKVKVTNKFLGSIKVPCSMGDTIYMKRKT